MHEDAARAARCFGRVVSNWRPEYGKLPPENRYAVEIASEIGASSRSPVMEASYKKNLGAPACVAFAAGFEESRSQERCGLGMRHVCGNADAHVLLPFPATVASWDSEMYRVCSLCVRRLMRGQIRNTKQIQISKYECLKRVWVILL